MIPMIRGTAANPLPTSTDRLIALLLTPLVYYGRSGSPRRALLFRFATRL